jgi:uncharacterized membrane protein YphA (DoxX/SURF4 family)
MINLKAIVGSFLDSHPDIWHSIPYLRTICSGIAAGAAMGSRRSGGSLFDGSVACCSRCLHLDERSDRLSAAVLGMFCFVCAAVLLTMKLKLVIHQGGERTGAFEALALGGAACALAGSSPGGVDIFHGWQRLTAALGKAGLYLFAFSLLIFGVQHFMHAPYIATLIPAWMPAHLFLAYFTGAAFIAAAIAIASGIQARLGACC